VTQEEVFGKPLGEIGSQLADGKGPGLH